MPSARWQSANARALRCRTSSRFWADWSPLASSGTRRRAAAAGCQAVRDAMACCHDDDRPVGTVSNSSANRAAISSAALRGPGLRPGGRRPVRLQTRPGPHGPRSPHARRSACTTGRGRDQLHRGQVYRPRPHIERSPLKGQVRALAAPRPASAAARRHQRKRSLKDRRCRCGDTTRVHGAHDEVDTPAHRNEDVWRRRSLPP